MTDRERLLDLKGSLEGERLFVVGNGPSLRKTNLELLQGEKSFGLNACARFFSWTSWRPSYYVCDTTFVMDQHHVPWAWKAINAADQAFLMHNAPLEFPGIRLHFVHSELVKDPEEIEWWSDDPTEFVSRFGTISLIALQLGVWMRANPIYVIGMDLDFKKHTERGADPNHADPDYNPPQPSMNWSGMTLSQSFAHLVARRNAERHGIEILNATVGGELLSYPRVDYESLFNGRKS